MIIKFYPHETKQKKIFHRRVFSQTECVHESRERLLFYHHHQHHIQASCIYSQRSGYRNKLFNETQKYLFIFIFIFNEMEEEEEEVKKTNSISSKPQLN